MKKLFLAIIALASFAVFANNSGNNSTGTKTTAPVDTTLSAKIVKTTGTSKEVKAVKGQITLTADSLALYRRSDSSLAFKANFDAMIPVGYTLTEKPR